MSDDILVSMKMKMAMNQDLIFYTSFMYGLELKLGDTPFNTACTDGLSITFTESFLKGCSEAEREGLFLHEIRHITDMHEYRKAGRDHGIWNAACDHAINLDLTADGFKLPQVIDPDTGETNICCDKKFKGMSAEQIYEELVQEQDKSKTKPMMPDVSDGTGQDDVNGNAQGQGDLDAQGDSSEDIQDEIKDLLIQAVQIAERTVEGNVAGKVPANILRMVDAWLNPVVPWQDLLQKYMNQKCKDDYSWQRPNRRYMAHRLYVPSQYSEQLGNIHFFIDGSCSVSKRMFDMQVGQIKWIKHNLNPKEIKIIIFNTRIVDVFTFDEHTPINVDFRACGGTAVGEIVEYMEKNTCECNIILTDGYFNQKSLKKIKPDILCLIYDNNNFSWEGSETIYLPPEK